MTSVQLSAILGIFISLCFSLIPGLKTWYGGLADTYQRLVMAGFLVFAALVAFGAACGRLTIPGVDLTSVSCDSAGADRKSTRLNSSHIQKSRMPSSA